MITDHRPIAGPTSTGDDVLCTRCNRPMREHTRFSAMALGTAITLAVVTVCVLYALWVVG